MRVRAVAVLLLAGAATIAACGVGSERHAQRINPAQLRSLGTTPLSEPDVTASVPLSSSPPSAPGPRLSTTTVADIEVELYFVRSDSIEQVRRSVPGDSSRRQVLDMLSNPPSDEELRSTIPAGLITGVERRGTGELVDLDSEVFSQVDPLEQPLLFGQIVLTLTGLPDSFGSVDKVRFELDGVLIPAMRGDSTLSDRLTWLRASDYRELLGGTVSVPPVQ